jgi:hypothetical protein
MILSFTADKTKPCGRIDGDLVHAMYGGAAANGEPAEMVYVPPQVVTLTDEQDAEFNMYMKKILLNKLLRQQYEFLIKFIRGLISNLYNDQGKIRIAPMRITERELIKKRQLENYPLIIKTLENILEYLNQTLSRIINEGIFDYSAYSLMRYIVEPDVFHYVDVSQISDTLKKCFEYKMVDIENRAQIAPPNLYNTPYDFGLSVLNIVQQIRQRPPNVAIQQITDFRVHPSFKINMNPTDDYYNFYTEPLYKKLKEIFENPLNRQPPIDISIYYGIESYIEQYVHDRYASVPERYARVPNTYKNTDTIRNEKSLFMEYIWDFVVTRKVLKNRPHRYSWFS